MKHKNRLQEENAVRQRKFKTFYSFTIFRESVRDMFTIRYTVSCILFLFVCFCFCFSFCVFKIIHNQIHKLTIISSLYIIIKFSV